ncbi:hypothetical protein [Streptomyces sp. NBC_00582]|uniref:hypothetical protein n=1 Tax=Streptomyces sp. NBC_00582 TaxID=2975783 RepID=UPI001414FEFB|nr:hypothetical protein [Streptomyces sp. NBC_00582]WUB63722.1 hypothetical protein OG852_26660 [Streptomyces sp. NBC_00582]
MEAVAASVIAVLGTLLGAGLTHRFQVRAVERTERFTRDERLRQERMDAYGSYAGALVNYRRALVHRWFREHEGGSPEEVTENRMAGYELRSVAQEALFRVQMLSPDETLVQRAWEVLLQIDRVHKAADPEDFDRCRDITRELIKDFVTTAKGTLGLT